MAKQLRRSTHSVGRTLRRRSIVGQANVNVRRGSNSERQFGSGRSVVAAKGSKMEQGVLVRLSASAPGHSRQATSRSEVIEGSASLNIEAELARIKRDHLALER